jgi:hypothetical protein
LLYLRGAQAGAAPTANWNLLCHDNTTTGWVSESHPFAKNAKGWGAQEVLGKFKGMASPRIVAPIVRGER